VHQALDESERAILIAFDLDLRDRRLARVVDKQQVEQGRRRRSTDGLAFDQRLHIRRAASRAERTEFAIDVPISRHRRPGRNATGIRAEEERNVLGPLKAGP